MIITGSTVGMFEVLLLFLPSEDRDDEVWQSSKSPPLTLLEGDVALLRLEAMVMNPWSEEKVSCVSWNLTIMC